MVPPLLHLFQRRVPPVVEFPAVRYLQETKREAQRTVQLQHLLLMLLRILAVVLIVLAAARPVVTGGIGARHEPTALVLIVDNSLSSGAVQGGTRVIDDIAMRARETLREAQDGDAVWLMDVDGIARRGRPADLLADVIRLTPDARRLDLDAALRTAASLVATSGYTHGEVHVLSDLQRTALGSTVNSRRSTADYDTLPVNRQLSTVDSAFRNLPILIYHPKGDPPANRGTVMARPSPALWLPAGGDIRIGVGGGPSAGAAPATVQLSIDGRSGARSLAGTSGEVVLSASRLAPGWHTGIVTLDPDELRADDRRHFAVRVVAPAGVGVAPAAETGSFLYQAIGVLTAGGQVHTGTDVRLGGAPGGSGAVVIFPPADVSAVGALNRALETARVPWRFGARQDRQDTIIAPALPELAGVRVLQRWRLEESGAQPGRRDTSSAVLARAGDDPWLVRSGRVILLGSRLVPEQTTLPLSGAFVPFVSALVNRIARGESGVIEATAGDPVTLPAGVTAVAASDSAVPVPSAFAFTAPAAPGVYALRHGADTAGMLVVNADPRESDLTRASPAELATLWRGARIDITEDARAYGAQRFRGAGRSEITGPLLFAALLVLIAETLLAAGIWGTAK
jgi:hypothetical protein